MSGAWANCSPPSSLPLLGLNQADEGLRENDRSLILSRRGGPGVVSERGSCAPSPVSGVLPDMAARMPPRVLHAQPCFGVGGAWSPDERPLATAGGGTRGR